MEATEQMALARRRLAHLESGVFSPSSQDELGCAPEIESMWHQQVQ